MESIQAISNEIREVGIKIDAAKRQAKDAKNNVKQQKTKLSEVEAEVAEKEKINKIFECLETLDFSRIKTPALNIARIPEAIDIIRNLHDESSRTNRYVNDHQRLLTQYENDFERYEKEVKTLTEYLQGLFIQLKFKAENEKQTLDKLLQSNQQLVRTHQPQDANTEKILEFVGVQRSNLGN